MGVKVVVSSSGTLRQTLMKVKTPREDMKKKDIVYEVPCMDCDTSYIGDRQGLAQENCGAQGCCQEKG